MHLSDVKKLITTEGEALHHPKHQAKALGQLLIALQALMVIVFLSHGGSMVVEEGGANTGITGYGFYSGVIVMMIVGFGYLMTFMKWYGFSSVGFCLLVTALLLQWALCIETFFDQMYNSTWGPIPMDIYSIFSITCIIAAPLISFGAVIGKVSPLQLILMVLLEIIAHGFTLHIVLDGFLEVADVGGTYSEHMFGCYFGLAVAYVLGKPKSQPQTGTVPDIFAFIGTVFLWAYWPSFVAGGAEANSPAQQRAVINTIMCLASSTVTTFWISSTLNNEKFRAVDIQNATLAGGVAIGCIADLDMNAGGALIIGSLCGVLSTYGFNRVQPYLEERFGLHDTCGIHNLHGMPSIFGGIASTFAWAANSSQAGQQFAGIILCLIFAVGSGYVVGLLLKPLNVYGIDDNGEVVEFTDLGWWEIHDYPGHGHEGEAAHKAPAAAGAEAETLKPISAHNSNGFAPVATSGDSLTPSAAGFQGFDKFDNAVGSSDEDHTWNPMFGAGGDTHA